MASSVIVTAKTGPAVQATALTIASVTSLKFDLERKVLQVNEGGTYQEFDLYGVTSVSYSISGANYTITIS